MRNLGQEKVCVVIIHCAAHGLSIAIDENYWRFFCGYGSERTVSGWLVIVPVQDS